MPPKFPVGPQKEALGKFNVHVNITYTDGIHSEYDCHEWTDTPANLALTMFDGSLRIFPHFGIRQFHVTNLKPKLVAD